MYKGLFFVLVLGGLYLKASYISVDKINKNKKSLQVSTCESRECIVTTHREIDKYDYITIKEDAYYVTYLVNIENENEEKIMSSLKDKFPDMILRRRYTQDKEMYALKAYDEAFFLNKNYKTKVKTKSIDLYEKPIHTSEIIDKKQFGDIINIDGCNEFEWCKQKSKKAYLPLYQIELLEKIKPKKQKSKKNQPITDKFLLKYKAALNHFKKLEYEKAYKLLSELFEERPNDPDINYYLGRSAYETKRYHEATVAYERVLFEKPDSTRVKFEMARTYIATGNYKEAKKLLLEVKADEKTPININRVSDILLGVIAQKEQKHFLSGILMAGVVFDSNVNSRSKHDTFDNVYFSSFDTYLDLSNTTEDEETIYHQEIGIVNYAYKISDTISNKHDFMLYYKSSFEDTLNSKDVKMVTYTPALSVTHDEKLTVDYAMYFDYMWIGGADYIKSYALLPKATYLYSQTDTITGQLKVQRKFYADEASKGKNSLYIEGTAGLSHIYDQKLTLSPSITLIDEEKNSGNTEGVDYSGVKLALGASYIYEPVIILNPSASFAISRYEGQDSSYQVQQLDREFKVAMSATYIYSPEWIFQGATDYTYQTSSMQSEEYNKYTISVNVIRPF